MILDQVTDDRTVIPATIRNWRDFEKVLPLNVLEIFPQMSLTSGMFLGDDAMEEDEETKQNNSTPIMAAESRANMKNPHFVGKDCIEDIFHTPSTEQTQRVLPLPPISFQPASNTLKSARRCVGGSMQSDRIPSRNREVH